MDKKDYMKKLSIFLMIASTALLVSCGCGSDMSAGNFDLDQSSIDYLVYSGDESLSFKSAEGEELRFTSASGLQRENISIPIRELCNNGPFDSQSLLFRGERRSIHFSNNNQSINLFFNVETFAEIDESLDTMPVFDMLRISINGTSSLVFSKIIKHHQGNASEKWKTQELNEAQRIGDIELLGVNFKDVYHSNSGDGMSVYYTKDQGLIGFSFNENELHVLAN